MRILRFAALLFFTLLGMTLSAQELRFKSSLLWTNIKALKVVDGIAHCAFVNGYQAIDLTDHYNPRLLGKLDIFGGSPHEIEVDGHYVYCLSSNMLNIIDIANVAAPILISTIPSEYLAACDIKIKDSYLYLSDGNFFKIYDISLHLLWAA
jgi:hypothetical protein